MKLQVYYDGKCGLCSKEIHYYMSIDKEKKFSWIDVTEQYDELEKIGISLSNALMYLHAIDLDGRLRTGVDAFVLIWNNLPGWKFLGFLISLPIIKSVARFVYRIFARWRFNHLSHCQTLIR